MSDCVCTFQGAFHVGRPEYVQRGLRTMPWRTKEKLYFLAYRQQKIPRINEFLISQPGRGVITEY